MDGLRTQIAKNTRNQDLLQSVAGDAPARRPSSSACQRQCGATFLSVLVQLLASVVFVVLGLWAGSLALETTRIVGVTTVPPGLLYGDAFPPPPPS